MNKTDKKKIAAIAGVMLCLSAQPEPAAVEIQPADETPKIPGEPVPGTSIWGLSGRQAQMQTRTLLQLKAFRSL